MIQPGGTRGLSGFVAGHPLDAVWIIRLMPPDAVKIGTAHPLDHRPDAVRIRPDHRPVSSFKRLWSGSSSGGHPWKSPAAFPNPSGCPLMPFGSSAGCRRMPSNAVKIGTGHPLDAA